MRSSTYIYILYTIQYIHPYITLIRLRTNTVLMYRWLYYDGKDVLTHNLHHKTCIHLLRIQWNFKEFDIILQEYLTLVRVNLGVHHWVLSIGGKKHKGVNLHFSYMSDVPHAKTRNTENFKRT